MHRLRQKLQEFPWARTGRLFAPGEVRLALLSLLSDAPGHGYDLMTRLGERCGGGYEPSAGVVMVPVDRAQIIQVFTNLVGNAVAYTPPGGLVMVSSTVSKIGSTPGVTVLFHNDRPAIPPEDLPHLFRRF